MKHLSIFYAVLFLLISPFLAFAADITLKETPMEGEKAISVEVDSKGEAASSLKIAVKVSDNVNVSDITNGDYTCATFSSTQNGTTIEITCTTEEEAIINQSIAKILFTSDSDEYSFTVLSDESQIGDLPVENTVDITVETEKISSDSNADSTTSETTTTAPTQSKNENPVSNNKKKTFTSYLPYVLLGIAGVLLVSIITLLVTKGKKESPTKETTPTHITQPPLPTPETQLKEEKPTLQEMVNAGTTTDTIPTEQPPVVTPEINHDKDLEALLMSENPRMEPASTLQQETTSTIEETTAPEVPTINPVEAPVGEITPLQETTFAEEQINTDYSNTDPLTVPVGTVATTEGISAPESFNGEGPYVANTSEGGLPSIGFTSPTGNPPTIEPEIVAETHIGEAETTPTTMEAHSDLYTTPTETIANITEQGPESFPTQPEIEVPATQETMDLQELVNNEVNNIPTAQPAVTTEAPPPTTEDVPIVGI